MLCSDLNNGPLFSMWYEKLIPGDLCFAKFPTNNC